MKMAKRKILKKKQPERISYNLTEMENTQLEFARIKAQKKMLEEREAELKERLDGFMTQTLKPDSKGHYLFTTINEKGEKIHLQKQSRRKVTLDPERAIDYLTEHGYKDLIQKVNYIPDEVTKDQIIEVLEKNAKHLIDEKTAVDENALEQLVMSEEIPMADFEALCEIKQTYAMTFVKDSVLEINEEG